jgi:hypothetical protein
MSGTLLWEGQETDKFTLRVKCRAWRSLRSVCLCAPTLTIALFFHPIGGIRPEQKNTNMIFSLDGTWNQKWICWLHQQQYVPLAGRKVFYVFFPELIINIVTNGGVAWLIKCGFRIGYWIYSLRLQATTNYNHFEHFLQQRWQFTEVPLGPTGPTLLPGPTKRLGSLGSWTSTGIAFSELDLDLPLNCPLTLGLLLTVLLNSLLYCRATLCHTA